MCSEQLSSAISYNKIFPYCSECVSYVSLYPGCCLEQHFRRLPAGLQRSGASLGATLNSKCAGTGTGLGPKTESGAESMKTAERLSSKALVCDMRAARVFLGKV